MKLRRNNISVMFLAVTRCMAKHLICVLTLDGIQEKDLLYVAGCFVENDLHGLMNCSGTEEHILVSKIDL